MVVVTVAVDHDGELRESLAIAALTGYEKKDN
jgi:hypothetical protein